MMELGQGLFFKDKGLKLSLLGEVQVNGKPRRARDLQSGQEVTEERIIKEYHDVQGRKMAKKIEVKRDGKDYLKAEVVETQLLDQVDDSEFAMP